MQIIPFFMLFTCLSPWPSPYDVRQVEFMSLTRGYHERLTITSDSVVLEHTDVQDRSRTVRHSRTIKPSEWKSLIRSFHKITWSEFENLESPTNKRAFDGARHSSIVVATADGATHQHSFDDDSPNERLFDTMKCIKQLSEDLK